MSKAMFNKDTCFHLIGIAGTAMAGVALLLKELGYQVQGSDSDIYPPMSTLLEENEIPCMMPFSIHNLPKNDKVVVIVGNAISRGNVELETALNLRLPIFSMPEIIRFLILMRREPIVVTGTHGKTTTTSLMTYTMKHCHRNVGYLIGGIPKDFQKNAYLGLDPIFVIEGDEYDTAYFDKRSKFLHYVPKIVILLNIEFDHSDIFQNIDEIERSFYRLILTIPENGLLIYFEEDERVSKVAQFARCKKISFGLENGDVHLFKDNSTESKIVFPDGRMYSYQLSLTGKHNLCNMLAVATTAFGIGLDMDLVIQSFQTFRGVIRRMDVIYQNDMIVIDDFGHHPTAIMKTLEGIKQKYPNRRILVAFDPRSNTSVRKFFQKEWVKTFALADRVWINQLHRLEKIPIQERLDREQLVHDLKCINVEATAVENSDQMLNEMLETVCKDDIVVFFSNGSFQGIKEKFVQYLKSKN
ncbi:MAG: Mur ligase family protein [bacterium]|nr:Mur ligase family protein [bacterium]